MATTTRSQLSGFKELDKVLKALPGRLAERELTNAVRAGARVIQKEVKARAPRGAEPSEASKKFGPLHREIKVRRVKKRSRHSVEFEIHTGRAFYASFIEFGTVKIAPRPFMSPALDASAQAAFAKIGTALAKGIERTANELVGKFGSIRKSTLKRL